MILVCICERTPHHFFAYSYSEEPHLLQDQKTSRPTRLPHILSYAVVLYDAAALALYVGFEASIACIFSSPRCSPILVGVLSGVQAAIGGLHCLRHARRAHKVRIWPSHRNHSAAGPRQTASPRRKCPTAVSPKRKHAHFQRIVASFATQARTSYVTNNLAKSSCCCVLEGRLAVFPTQIV